MRGDETVDESQRSRHGVPQVLPGVVILVDAGRPSRQVLDLPSEGLELGRGSHEGALGADERASRRHVGLSWSNGAWTIRDRSSRNGTFVNGRKLERSSSTLAPGPVLVRLGRSLVWGVDDLRPYLHPRRRLELGAGPLCGGRLARAWDEIEVASRAGDTLLIRGESGAGKELAARHFHEARFGKSDRAPFVGVNCAAVPEGLAERLLFGAQRGAYSGATVDAQGYVAAAHRGTLFLDEVAELDRLVQAKLLRVLETREVLPLGASRPQPVQIQLCAATHKDLREEVSARRFREDLFFRLGRPEVVLPPLRERLDELPWLIARELERVTPARNASVGFVEACALRAWPGNVRELLRELRLLAHVDLAGAEALEAVHLPELAGAKSGITPAAQSGITPASKSEKPSAEQARRVLAEHHGNVSSAARAMGLHRTQLRRLLAKDAEGDGSTEQ